MGTYKTTSFKQPCAKNHFDIIIFDSSKERAKLQIHITELSSSRVTFVCDGTRHQIDCFRRSKCLAFGKRSNFLIQEPSPFVSGRREEDSLDILPRCWERFFRIKLGDEVEKGTAICQLSNENGASNAGEVRQYFE